MRGMYLVGGGGLLRGLAQRIERETKVPVKMSNVPLEAVVLGAGHVHRALRGAQGHVHGRPPLTRRCGSGRPRRPGPRRRAASGSASSSTSRRGSRPTVALGRRRGAPPRARAPTHVDRTDRPFVTLDPAGSTDLDQAFAIERAGADVVLHYAIADVGWFVDPAMPSTSRRGSEASRCTCPTSGPGSTRRCCRRVRPACCPTVRGRPWCSPCGSTRRARSRSTASSGRWCAAGPSSPTRPSGRPICPRVRRAGPPHRRCRGTPRRAPRRVPRAGAGRGRRPLDVALRSPPAERGRQRRAVAGHQPGRRRRAARRRDRAVPRDGRADRGRRAPAASDGAGVRPVVAGRRSRWPTFQRSLPTDEPRAAAFLSPCAGPVAAPRTSRSAGRDAMARRDGCDLRPRHGAAAAPRRSLRGRGGACDRQRSARRRRGAGGVRRPARRRWRAPSSGPTASSGR